MAAQAAARLRDHNESKQQERRTSDAAAPGPSRRLPARRRSDSIPVSASRHWVQGTKPSSGCDARRCSSGCAQEALAQMTPVQAMTP